MAFLLKRSLKISSSVPKDLRLSLFFLPIYFVLTLLGHYFFIFSSLNVNDMKCCVRKQADYYPWPVLVGRTERLICVV